MLVYQRVNHHCPHVSPHWSGLHWPPFPGLEWLPLESPHPTDDAWTMHV